MRRIKRIKNRVLGIMLAVQLSIALLWSIILPEFYRFTYALLLLSLFTLIVLWLNNKKLVGEFIKHNLKAYSANKFLSVFMVLAIIASINYIVSRYDYRIDITRNKLNTLSEQTIKVLAELEDDVHYIAFIDQATHGQYFRRVMDQYRYHSNRISYEVVDPNREPLKARAYNIVRYGTVVASMGGRETRTDFMTEEALTNSIIKLNRKEEKKIYFLSGHMGRNIDSTGPGSYSKIKGKILGQGYLVEELNIINYGLVPEDAGLLIIAAPTKAFFEREVKLILDYLKRGGSLLVLSDPAQPEQDLGPEANVNKILSTFGIELNNDVIIDTSARLFGLTEAMPVIQDYDSFSVVTSGFNELTVFPFAQSIDVSGVDRDKHNLYKLCRTSESSWGEVDAKSGVVSYDEGVDRPGPLNICIKLVDKDEEGFKIIVFGNSSFVSDQFISHVANSDLFLNAVSYLLGDDELLAIRPRSDEAGRIDMPGNPTFALITVYIIPFAVLVYGIVYWYRRRRK